MVSHDREFLDNVVTSTFVLEGDGSVGCYPGGYEDYLRQRPAQVKVKGEGEQGKAVQPSSSPASSPSPKKLSYNEKRELEALPGKIEALEQEVAAIEAFLSDGAAIAADPEKCRTVSARLPVCKEELEAAVDRWAELEERAS